MERLTATVTVAEAGEHVLRVFMVDPGIAVDQIVIDTGGLPVSYLAPPEVIAPSRWWRSAGDYIGSIFGLT